jgi:hypothetical protein
MPIRFRCAYCNQLLGIARRKAGQVVRCPTCAGQVVVPEPEPGDEDDSPDLPPPPPPSQPLPDQPAAQPPPPPGPAPPVFERSDFEDLFNEPVVQQGPGTGAEPPSLPASRPPPKVAAPPAPGPAYDVERVNVPTEPQPTGGILLSPVRATILTVVVIVGFALAFAAGWLVGRFGG